VFDLSAGLGAFFIFELSLFILVLLEWLPLFLEFGGSLLFGISVLCSLIVALTG
jgi:hypothetical protein